MQQEYNDLSQLEQQIATSLQQARDADDTQQSFASASQEATATGDEPISGFAEELDVPLEGIDGEVFLPRCCHHNSQSADEGANVSGGDSVQPTVDTVPGAYGIEAQPTQRQASVEDNEENSVLEADLVLSDDEHDDAARMSAPTDFAALQAELADNTEQQ